MEKLPFCVCLPEKRLAFWSTKYRPLPLTLIVELLRTSAAPQEIETMKVDSNATLQKA